LFAGTSRSGNFDYSQTPSIIASNPPGGGGGWGRGIYLLPRGGRIAALLPEEVARHETFAETGVKPKFADRAVRLTK